MAESWPVMTSDKKNIDQLWNNHNFKCLLCTMHRRVKQQEPNLFSDPMWLSFFCFSAENDNSGIWQQDLHVLNTATIDPA